MKYLLISFCFLLTAVITVGQPRQNPPVKQVVPELKKLLSGTGLPYKMISDNLGVIPYEGVNIASYNVVVQKVGDLYIIYADLTEALPGKITESNYKYLLQQSGHFDIIKIGMNEDDSMVYVRADLYRSTASTALLTRIIKQVANVTNIIGGDLK